VAVGLPKIERSVRLATKTFSVQVPETAMELGPTEGKEANAAPMVVKAPPVPPGQPTVVSVANAWLADAMRRRQHRSSLDTEIQIFIFSLKAEIGVSWFG